MEIANRDMTLVTDNLRLATETHNTSSGVQLRVLVGEMHITRI
jgi:hypothetical protein